MCKFAFLFTIAFASHIALAQTSQPIGIDAERNLAELGSSTNATMVQVYDNRYEGIKGTPYFKEHWAKATIAANNTVYKNVEVKYNVYESNLLYRTPKGAEYVLLPARVDSFLLVDGVTQQKFMFRKFPALAAEAPKLGQHFALVLHDGKQVQLVMVPQKHLMKADFKGPYSAGNKYDELQDLQSYYLFGPDQTFIKVKLNKKSLLKALPGKQDKVAAYIAAERLDAGNAQGWAKALAYYESL
ncbi:hypothetical protein GCM10023188_10120 [Pontibacter saemangeumensis]|uniref:Uncharacterized protein n=1 Tax=Pontibacter saemangeumensis TaxID=1084525 RepID=A0ABP8LCT2_9BACT